MCNITAATITAITSIHRTTAATDAEILMIISVWLTMLESLVIPTIFYKVIVIIALVKFKGV